MGGKAALIAVLGFGFIFGYIGFRINELETRSVHNSATYLEATTAHNIAVAGANVGLAKLYQDTSLWTWSSTSDTILSQQTVTGGGSFTVRFGKRQGDYLRLQSYSSFPSGGRTLRDTVIVVLRRYNLWELRGFLLSEDCNQFNWITGDTVWGKAHDNGNSPVLGTPVFTDKITVSGAFVPAPGVSPNFAIFYNGYETGVSKVPIPTTAQVDSTRAKADTLLSGTYTFELVDTTISLRPVGFIKIRRNANAWTGTPDLYYFYNWDTTLPRPNPDSILLASIYSPSRFAKNRVIWTSSDLYVRGVVNGQTTIGATQNVHIRGDVVYRRDPRIEFSQDMIGIVARNFIYLDNNPFVKNEFRIDGATLASEYHDIVPSGGKYVWRSFGANLAQKHMHIADYDKKKEPRLKQGFWKRLTVDPRLTNLRPPNFPEPPLLGKRLQIVNWWENVRIPEY